MLEALEKDLCLNPNLRDRKKIIEVFELAKATQLPVVIEKKVIGILDLFKLLNSDQKNINIIELMETDIVVAGEERNVFSFKNSKQEILPFSDTDGNYMGFVNKLFQKCYLPSKEYMQVVERSMSNVMDQISGDEFDYDGIKMSFDVLLESNYDGIYITVDKGETLSINNESKYAKGITLNDISIDNNNANVNLENRFIDQTVSIIQNVQKRNEISIPDNKITDGGIVRVIRNLNDFEKIKNELNKAQQLADKYHNELEFFRWEHSKTEDIIANSLEMKRIINLAIRIAKVDSTVLIIGQSGVGKGVLTKIIHSNSDRKDGPLIKIDCGSIPENLLESELFGYEQGSFTGADKKGKVGLIELADGGTLFLDEIGELPLNLQVKLLRVIQDREIMRIGGKESIPVDIRIVAATNRDLEELIKENKFRKDLYYRLNVVPIKIPPLNDRKEDIKPLIERNLSRFNAKYGQQVKIDPSALKVLIDYDWPGNVRELENLIEYLTVTTTSNKIEKENLPENILKSSTSYNSDYISLESVDSFKDAVDQYEKNILIQAMKRTKSTEEMAKMLKLDRSTITRKLKKYDIEADFK